MRERQINLDNCTAMMANGKGGLWVNRKGLGEGIIVLAS